MHKYNQVKSETSQKIIFSEILVRCCHQNPLLSGGAKVTAFKQAAAAPCHMLNVTQTPGGWERVCVLRGDFAIWARRYQHVAGGLVPLTPCVQKSRSSCWVKAVRDDARALSFRRGIGPLGLRCDGECLPVVEEERESREVTAARSGASGSRAERSRHVTCCRSAGTCGCALASRATTAGASKTGMRHILGLGSRGRSSSTWPTQLDDQAGKRRYLAHACQVGLDRHMGCDFQRSSNWCLY